MPTPSSNNPPDPQSPSPRSFSFSTCPEDTNQRASTSSWHEPSQSSHRSSGMESHDDDRGDDGASQGPVRSPASEAVTIAETIMDDVPHSAASSRSNTLSPAPAFRSAVRSSMAARLDGIDSPKQADNEDDRDNSQRDPSGVNVRPLRGQHEPQPSMSTELDKSMDAAILEGWNASLHTPSMGSDYSSMRVIPTSPSSFLRPGSKFHGTQQSERQVYDVQVEIKHVDMRESFLCGYLRIQGLTEDHPTLTTYFEGEIIGTKYSFITKHESWGATDKIDLNHWAKFNAFRPFQKQARRGPVVIRDIAQRENIFMRWKEHFLVPDHRVRTISGASFEGFYYICFNQVKGEVSGIYFHSKSEKFQQLELKHVEDRGCFGALEFR